MMRPWLYNRQPILVVFLSVVILGAWLGRRGLAEPDEGRFASISLEMAHQTDWIVPHLNGVPHFQKPPLVYWISAAFIRLFGANEWAVRLTPFLAGIGTLLLTMYIAGILFGKECQWKAGLVLMASTVFFAVARLITTDMLLTFFITAAVAGLVAYMRGGRKAGLAVFYLGMGLGFLTKGPLGILIPSLAGACAQWGQWRQRQPVARLFWWLGLPAALCMGVSWYVALAQRDGSLLEYFFRYEFVDRIASNTHNRSKPVWFYPAVLALGFLPWTTLAGLAVRDAWRRRRRVAPATGALFVGWVAVPYVILSLVVSKMVTYLLPLMPPLAILVARWLDHPATGDRWRRPARIMAWSLPALLLSLPALALSPRIRLPPLHSLPVGFWAATLLAIASFLILARAVGKGLPLGAFLFWMAGTWGCVLLAADSQANLMMTGGNRPVRALTKVITRLDPSGTAPVFVLGSRAHGTEFYLRRHVYRHHSKSDVVLPLEDEPARRIVHDEQATAQALAGAPAFIIVKSKRCRTEPGLSRWPVILRDEAWTLLASPQTAVDPTTSPAPAGSAADTAEIGLQDEEGRPSTDRAPVRKRLDR